MQEKHISLYQYPASAVVNSNTLQPAWSFFLQNFEFYNFFIFDIILECQLSHHITVDREAYIKQFTLTVVHAVEYKSKSSEF